MARTIRSDEDEIAIAGKWKNYGMSTPAVMRGRVSERKKEKKRRKKLGV